MSAKSEQKERSRVTILDSASSLLRAKGIAGTSVAEVMKGAGLTVGGFYAHFASKERLIDEVLRQTTAQMRARLFDRLEEMPAVERIEVVLRRYLSPAHRDERVAGCPLPAVVGEIGTTAAEHQEVLAEQIEALASRLAEQLPESDSLRRRHLALGLLALMYGGLSLSRALRGTPLSDEVLQACRAIGGLAAQQEGG